MNAVSTGAPVASYALTAITALFGRCPSANMRGPAAVAVQRLQSAMGRR